MHMKLCSTTFRRRPAKGCNKEKRNLQQLLSNSTWISNWLNNRTEKSYGTIVDNNDFAFKTDINLTCLFECLSRGIYMKMQFIWAKRFNTSNEKGFLLKLKFPVLIYFFERFCFWNTYPWEKKKKFCTSKFSEERNQHFKNKYIYIRVKVFFFTL